MSRLIYSLAVSVLLFALTACGNHKRRYHHQHGVADTNSSTVIDNSITNVTINFWDPLSESDVQRIVDQLRQEIIAWEIEHQQYVLDVVFEILFSANFDIDLEIDLTGDAIWMGCIDPEHFDLPPGILRQFLCQWHGLECHQEGGNDEEAGN